MALCITRYTFCSAERGFLPHSSCNGQFRSVHTLRSGMPENLYVRAILAAIVILTHLFCSLQCVCADGAEYYSTFQIRPRRLIRHGRKQIQPRHLIWNTILGIFTRHILLCMLTTFKIIITSIKVNAKSWLKRDFVDIFHKRETFALFFAFNIFCASP
jgi:hypothetical protein